MVKPHPPGCRPPSRPRVRPEDASDLTDSLVTELCSRGISITSDATKGQLRQGFGEGVCLILNELINQELLAQDFHFERPTWDEADQSQELAEEVDDESEVPRSDLGSEASVQSDDDQAEAFVEEPAFGFEVCTKNKETLLEPVGVSQVNAEVWRAEALRVRPKLQAAVEASQSYTGWRTTFTGVHQLCDDILELGPSSVAESLRLLQAERSEELARLQYHEDRFNLSLASSREDLGRLRSSSVQEAGRLDALHASVTALSAELATVSQDLEKAKAETSEQCEALNNAEKLAQLRASLQRMKEEDQQLALRVGALQHDLLHRRERWRAQEPEQPDRG